MKLRGDHWDFDVSIFLKIDRFEGATPHSPLKTNIKPQHDPARGHEMQGDYSRILVI